VKCSRKFRRGGRSHPEHGYILLTLMLLATLVVLALAAVAPELKQQMKRDREMELIHRGVQYSRAIKRFYKKTGRYPVRLEELESFNNIRYLRKRYKDPITGEDFKLLHFGEVKIGFAQGIAGGVAPGANAQGVVPSPTNPQGRFGPQSAFGPPAGLNPQGPPDVQAVAGQDANSASQPVASSAPGTAGDQSATSDSSSTSTSTSGIGGKGPVFGGGPIVGVVSTSNKISIREFNKKNHYKDWQFIYDPSSDRGGLLNTPAQPSLMQGPVGPAQGQGMPGTPVLTPGGTQQPPGNFGQQSMPMPNQPPDQMQPDQ
jgi:type II secretory pathway pseudopilin PulG